MNPELRQELLAIFTKSLQPPYAGSFKDWCEEFVELPINAYSIPGPVDFSISPYLHRPMQDITDPRIVQLNLCAATQTGKSLLSELAIPYWIINAPGPIFRIFHNKDTADSMAETRFLPLIRNCEVIKPLLNKRFSTKKDGITLPHMAVIFGASGTGLQHGFSVKYLLVDELHAWLPGQLSKFKARTTAFEGRKKIIVASQPSKVGSEWEQEAYSGIVYTWGWRCPKCNVLQSYEWNKLRQNPKHGNDRSGLQWDRILNDDKETTNIAKSSATARLECHYCDGVVYDTPTERRRLLDTGDYICTKNDGDPSIVTYIWPRFVMVNYSFASASAQSMNAKKMMKQTGLDEQWELFVEQVLGKFYKREDAPELSKILVELYDKTNLDKEWLPVMGVDVQRTGGVKYYVVRAWNKNGNESRRLDFGIARTWEEIDDIRKKHNVFTPNTYVDSGDRPNTQEIYQECIKHGEYLRMQSGQEFYLSWVPTKGDGNHSSYKHPDGVMRLYAADSYQDCGFLQGHKLKGVPAPLVSFSNFSIKTILMNLRDNRVQGIKWSIDNHDPEYDKQLYSEGLFDVTDKKTGLVVKRWQQTIQDNHYLDCEVLCLLGAMKAKCFSATKVNEDDIKKLIEAQKATN